MKQFSTGTGVAVLGVCILAATVVATQRGGSEAFAQGTGGDRRIVSTGMIEVPNRYDYGGCGLVAYRIWSDNVIDLRGLAYLAAGNRSGSTPASIEATLAGSSQGLLLHQWMTVDNGTSGFRPLTDVDMSGEVDGGDISQVLLDMNTTSEDFPPPPIDCTINAPR
jgi:hypothetical protein